MEGHGLAGCCLINEYQAAEFLGLAVKTLRQWRVSGRGPFFVRLSCRAIRYKPDDLQTWVSERRRHSTSDFGPTANT